MKAIILAAGYATRLRPLTEKLAKPLLPIAGRPMIERIYEKIAEASEIDAVHVVTNHKFAEGFAAWARDIGSRGGRVPVHVHDDGTTTNDTRLGAIGDVRFTIEQAGLEGEDLMIVAGDNLFEFSLADYVTWWRKKGEGSAIAVYDVHDKNLVKEYAVVELDASDRVTSFVEKPRDPQSTLAAIATYLYRAEHAAMIPTYLGEGNSPDQPGKLVAWLHTREPVYGYRFPGEWLDIGNHEQLLDADNRWRKREGKPTRETYSVEG
jgi:glucose-1-phosphate thymidylyltransferase